MFKHVVLYKLKDKSPQTLQTIGRNFKGMEGKIEGLLSVECGVDIIKSERSFDYCLICGFVDEKSYRGYLTHPEHLPVKAFMHTIVECSKSVDFMEENNA